MNKELRAKLQEITDNYKEWKISEQIKLIENLDIKHSITLQQEAIPGKLETFDFNCFMYALGLSSNDTIKKIRRMEGGRVFVSSDFIDFLIQNKLVGINYDEKQNGDIIIYFSTIKAEHAEMINKNMVISKWGEQHIWKHKIWEIPENYGDRFGIFKAITSDETLKAFLAYARAKGLVINN